MYGQPMYAQQPMQPMYGQPMQPMYQQPMQPVYQQPMMQPAYPQQQGQTVIVIDNDKNDGVPCQFCGTNTGQVIRRKIGIVTIVWAVCLLPLYMCCLPCCMDGCKDQ